MRVWIMLLGMMLMASAAGAADIAGKWGLSAGLGNGATEISLIRGHSASTAWILDARIDQFEASTEVSSSFPGSPPTTATVNNNRGTVSLGPRLRRYTHPESDFSPYWDVFLHGEYAKFHDASFVRRDFEQIGADLGFSIGAEYFTRWHCSVAAHSGLFDVRYARIKGTQTGFLGNESSKGHVQSASLVFAPQLFLRTYF